MLRRVLDGVVHQVSDEKFHHADITHHLDRLCGRLQSKVDVLGQRLGREPRNGIRRHLPQIEHPAPTVPTVRVDTRQGQQLLHQVSGAVHAVDDLAQRLGPRTILVRAQRDLRLGLQGRERGTQFVGRIRREAAFVLEGLLQALK